jgi:penicillin-binding protein A
VGGRIRVLAMVVMVLLGALLIQAANVEFRQSSSLSANPNNPRVALAKLSQARGEILAADGSVLAQSVPTPKGQYKYKRVYPEGQLMGHVTGFDSLIYGTWGIEASYNSYLITHPQPPRSLVQVLSPKSSTDSVALTIVPSLQKLAQSQLAGRDGAIVALNPKTGGIYALYSNPTYDPNPLAFPDAKVERFAWGLVNQRDSSGFSPLLALSFQRTFPPGSTFKVVTSTAAISKRPDLASKSYPVASTISLPDTNQTLSNFGFNSCGGTVAEMLPPSCDTGFALLGLDLGAATLWQQATEFGFDSKPPIDVPGAATSNFPTPAQLQHRLPFLAYGAIGQGDVTATALQNALVAAGIADQGTVMTPHLMREVRTAEGDLVTTYRPRAWTTATTPAVAAQVSTLMQEVVTQGTAAGVFSPALKVAAKTGTAQTSATNVNERTDDWMIAFAPYDDPQVALAVILPNQALSATGAAVAGPVMNCMVEGVAAYLAGQPVTNTATTCPSS